MYKRQQDAFRALSLAIARARFTADKIALLPDKAPENMEEALPFADHALALAGQLLAVKELHRKLWFDTNRHSDWEICAARYDDLYDQLRTVSYTHLDVYKRQPIRIIGANLTNKYSNT